MNIIDRYICGTWLRMLAICLCGFVSLYLVIDLIEKIPRFIRAGGAAADIAEYFIWKLPEMFGRTAIFSILMATVLTLITLTKDSEIIAMRSCGISLLRLSLPLILLGIVASILLLANAEMILPRSYAMTELIDRVKIKKSVDRVKFKRNNIWFRSESMIMQAKLFDPQAKILKGVVIWEVDSDMHPVVRIDAQSAEYQEGKWLLGSASRRSFRDAPSFTPQRMDGARLSLNLKVEDLQVLDSDADNMSIKSLYEYAENLRQGGYKANRYLTMMHTKLASPFGAVVMVLLALPFALRGGRSSGLATGIGISIMIGFVYFVVNAVLLSYGRSGVLPPMVAAWGANSIFVSAGIWMSTSKKG